MQVWAVKVLLLVCRLANARRDRKARLERDAAEKKVDILQKALRHHPGSSEVLRGLIAAAQQFQGEDEIRRRWQVSAAPALLSEAFV